MQLLVGLINAKFKHMSPVFCSADKIFLPFTDRGSTQLDLHGSVCFCNAIPDYMGLLLLCARTYLET